MKRIMWLALVPSLLGLLIACGSTTTEAPDIGAPVGTANVPETPPLTTKIPLTGSLNPKHDPTLFKYGDDYFVYSTHNRTRRSIGGLQGPWQSLGLFLSGSNRPAWLNTVSSGTIWAPHVTRVDDTYYMYYSISSFGTNNSAIGVATTQTPDIPGSWVDHGGPIISSGNAPGGGGATHNAIDPVVYQDDDGQWWIIWGSHFDGIMIQRLDNMTDPVGEITMIAHRGSEQFPVTNPNFNRIEGPAVFKRGDYYYLLTGWDWCCRSPATLNTYKIVIGRSEHITGPYVDKNGVRLDQGGGNIILNTRTSSPGVTPAALYRAPGGPDVYEEDGTFYLVYHAYRPQDTLGIRIIEWHDDWPYFPDAGPYDLQDGQRYLIRNQLSDQCLTVDDDGTNVVQAECEPSFEQTWQLQVEFDGFYSLTNMGAYCLRTADASGIDYTNTLAWTCGGPNDPLQQWYFDDMGFGYHRIVVKDANLALELDDVNGEWGPNVAGAFPRNGDHSAGSATQAGMWPPQHWTLEVSTYTITIADLLGAFDSFVAHGTLEGAGRGASAANRLNALRNMLVNARNLIDAEDGAGACKQLTDAQQRIHAGGGLQPSHFVTGDVAGSFYSLVAELKDMISCE